MEDKPPPLPLPSTIETVRLRLRPARETDAEAVLKILSDSRVREPLRMGPTPDIAKALDRIRDMNAPGAVRYAVANLVTDQFLGVVAVFAYLPGFRRAELGYMLDADHWGKGLMFEATSAVIDHCFRDANLNRIEAEPDPKNLPSVKLLKRLGFKEEGYLRERWIMDGVAGDSQMFGLLKSEWRAA